MAFGGAGVVTSQMACYVARVEADGANTWIRGFGSWNSFWWRPSQSLVVSADGSIAIGGDFMGSMDLGGGVFTAAPNDVSGYVASLDGSGAHRWSVHLGGAQPQSVRGVAVDLFGNVDVTGSFEGTIDFGGLTRTGVGSSDVFAARFDPSGQVLWGESFGDDGADDAVGIGIDAVGDLVLTGKFTGAIDFGGAQLKGLSSNVYLAKLGEGSIEPVLSITVLPRMGAIEAQWDISSRWTFERFLVLRDNSARTEPKIVAAGILGPSSGALVDRDVAPGVTYRYELVVMTPTGVQFRSAVVTTTVPMYTTQLSQNFPNPFNPLTNITYSLSTRSDVALVIYDVSGALVRRIDQGSRDAGEHIVEWDGRDVAGRSVGSGVYFYRLEGVSGVAPRKMVLLK